MRSRYLQNLLSVLMLVPAVPTSDLRVIARETLQASPPPNLVVVSMSICILTESYVLQLVCKQCLQLHLEPELPVQASEFVLLPSRLLSRRHVDGKDCQLLRQTETALSSFEGTRSARNCSVWCPENTCVRR